MIRASKYEAAILDALNLRGRVTINELAGQLGVSGETAWRHVEPLVKKGLAIRVHGGVTAPFLSHKAPFQKKKKKPGC
jgi:DeoR/GlpR family transcriptional regulator of sugar metabolism